jgi:hypothetical protein
MIVLHYSRADSTTITAANTHHAQSAGLFCTITVQSRQPSSAETNVLDTMRLSTSVPGKTKALWAFRPPPAPAVNGTWIQPYELPANAPPANPRAYLRARQLLANSRVSVMTDYPLSTSPRESTEKYNARLYYWGCTISRKESGITIGDSETNFKGHAHLTTKGAVPILEFQSLSWDSRGLPPRGRTV